MSIQVDPRAVPTAESGGVPYLRVTLGCDSCDTTEWMGFDYDHVQMEQLHGGELGAAHRGKAVELIRLRAAERGWVTDPDTCPKCAETNS